MMGWHGPQRWDPLQEIQREVGRLLQTFEPVQGWRAVRPFPPINVYESEDRFVLTAEVPGMEPDEVDVSLTGETLTLRGERKRSDSIREDQYRRQERIFGRWSRSITLPERIEGAAVTARCTQGILMVILPKSAEARPRQIAVSSSKD